MIFYFILLCSTIQALFFFNSDSQPILPNQYNVTLLNDPVTLRQIELEISPLSSEISEVTAQYFLDYATIGYCPGDRIEKWDCYDCIRGTGKDFIEADFIQNATTYTDSYIGLQPKVGAIVVSIEGTSEVQDWLSNLDTEMISIGGKETKPLLVHSGFLWLWESIRDYIITSVVALMKQHPNYSLVFTGHSMGGALAQLAVYDFVSRNITKWNQITLVTYGQPRVGNKNWANLFNRKLKRSIRVKDQRDLVPHLPLSSDYWHIDWSLTLLPDGTSKVCKAESDDAECGGLAQNLLRFNYPTPFHHKHYWGKSMNTYCEDLIA